MDVSARYNFTEPIVIQAQEIPIALNRLDIIRVAQMDLIISYFEKERG